MDKLENYLLKTFLDAQHFIKKIKVYACKQVDRIVWGLNFRIYHSLRPRFNVIARVCYDSIETYLRWSL